MNTPNQTNLKSNAANNNDSDWLESIGLKPEDITQIKEHGVEIESIARQLAIFKNGINKTQLKKPAIINDGIFPLPKETTFQYAAFFDKEKDRFTLAKFVPSSGAATRMFKFLLEFLSDYNPDKETINGYLNRQTDNSLRIFLVAIEKFPFYPEIAEAVRNTEGFATFTKEQKTYTFINILLNDERFNYANKPKGILPFHDYAGFIATPVFEHLKEAAMYATSNGEANMQFTISEEHFDGFVDCISAAKPIVEADTKTPINISFSYQKKSTDTIAVNLDNSPFRSSNGNLFFRPGGHGALIENLETIEADVVFIKNIDNVSHNNIDLISLYKKALAGILIELQQEVFSHLTAMENKEIVDNEINKALEFARNKLMLHIPANIYKYTPANKKQFVQETLNRPIRVCGMVKNEGEPGGGPFWVEDKNGEISLQIVESSQVDMESRSQRDIFAASTHFNPVDLVCGLKNYKGEYFKLTDFTDPSSGFIVTKNRMGKEVKSYELPGLWNGSMAGWITIFAEVPLETFNPVKTVNDLLKPAHQPH